MKKVISRKNLPNKMPVTFTIVCFLAMDYWGAPQWLFGAIGLLVLLLWIGFFYSLVNNDEVDLFDATKENLSKLVKESRFKERLEKAIKESEKQK